MKSDELKNERWKEFDFDELDLEIINSKAYHSANVEEDNTGIAYLTRTIYDNGFNMCVKNNALKINPANTISFGDESAHFFYQQWKLMSRSFSLHKVVVWILWSQIVTARQGRKSYGRREERRDCSN